MTRQPWGFKGKPWRKRDAQARPGLESADSHLRSTAEVTGYHIEASDGEIGHVKDFIVDDETWAIRYLEVDTQNWWPGKKVLVSPQWINRVSWPDVQSLRRPQSGNHPERPGVERFYSRHSRVRAQALRLLRPVALLGASS